MKHVAIIGFGAAGLSCFKALIKHATQCNLPLLIDIYQPREGFANGLSYQKDADYICLNHHHDFICIDVDKPYGFTQWLQEKHPDYLNRYQGYQPRWIFGKFLEAEFQSLFEKMTLKPRIFNEVVTSIWREQNKYRVACASNVSQSYDDVILAIGHPDQENIYNLSGRQYIHSPYPVSQKLCHIPQSDSVAIIGMGLTAVDCAIALSKQNHKGAIVLTSRSGNFSAKRTEPRAHQFRHYTHASLDKIARHEKNRLLRIAAILNKELKAADTAAIRALFLEEQLDNDLDMHWQNVLYSCNEQTEKAWSILSLKEQRLFFNHYHKKWLDRRVGVAPHNYNHLMQLQALGQLSFMGGLQEIEQGYKVRTENEKITADWVINAIGSPRFLIHSDLSIISNLVRHNLGSYHEFGGINVNFDTSELINKQGKVQPNIYAIGHITSGVFLYTPIMEHIVRHADKIAKHILRKFMSI